MADVEREAKEEQEVNNVQDDPSDDREEDQDDEVRDGPSRGSVTTA
jgi:hypothetical protein